MADLSGIKEHMDVLGSDGEHVGTVDQVEGHMIKLTRSESPDGKHHYLSTDFVDYVDDEVHLTLTAEETVEEWEDEDEDEEADLEQEPVSLGDDGDDEEDSDEWVDERR